MKRVRLEPAALGLESSTLPLGHCTPYLENSLASTFANSEDPDEMQHVAASGSTLFLKVKKDLQMKEYNICLVII